jgi:hypothetical protein
MMLEYSAVDARTIAILLDAVHGLPSRGVHCGSGLHCDMPAIWNGTDNVPPGWTSHVAGLCETVRLLVVDAQACVSGDSRLAVLSPEDRTTYLAARAKFKAVAEPALVQEHSSGK